MLRAVQAVATPAIACAAGRTVSEGARRVATCGAVARMAFNAMDTATLNLQYSPSRWVKRVPAEVAVQQHMDDAVTRTWAGTRAATSAQRAHGPAVPATWRGPHELSDGPGGDGVRLRRARRALWAGPAVPAGPVPAVCGAAQGCPGLPARRLLAGARQGARRPHVWRHGPCGRRHGQP